MQAALLETLLLECNRCGATATLTCPPTKTGEQARTVNMARAQAAGWKLAPPFRWTCPDCYDNDEGKD